MHGVYDALDLLDVRPFVGQPATALTYGSSLKEFRDFFAQTGAYDDRVKAVALVARQDEVYARAQDAMRSHEGSDLVYHEPGRMSRLMRPG
jgi:hypothetical protein